MFWQLREGKAETGLSGTGPQFRRAGGRASLSGADGQSQPSSGYSAMGPAGRGGVVWNGDSRAKDDIKV